MTRAPRVLALTADENGDAAIVDDLPTHAVAVLCVEDERTADDRIFDPGAFTWRQPPLTLTLNHDPDQRIGAVVAIGRTSSPEGLTVDGFAGQVGAEGNYVVGLLEFDLGLNAAGELVDPNALGRVAARQADTTGTSGPFLAGVSVEYGNDAYELECEAMDDDGWCDRYLMRWTAAEIGQVTLTGFQAIDSARIIETGGTAPAVEVVEEVEAIAASGGLGVSRWLPAPPLRAVLTAAGARPSTRAPRSAFDDPGLTEPTQLTITDDGRIYGHVALWNTCHSGIQSECILAPRSPSGYAHFHTGQYQAEDGPVSCGVLTTGCGHAEVWVADATRPSGRRVLNAREAVAHYDNVGTVAAYVRCGEDEHGIWTAGVLEDDLTDRQLRSLRAVSGDWRTIGGHLELVATLCVNTPGYGIPEPAGMVADGSPAVLVAAGIVRTTGHGCGCSGGCDSAELAGRVRQLEAIVAAAGLERTAVEALAASLV